MPSDVSHLPSSRDFAFACEHVWGVKLALSGVLSSIILVVFAACHMYTSIPEGLFQRPCSGCALQRRCFCRAMARPSSEPPAMKDLGPAIPTSSSLPPRSSVVSTAVPAPPMPPKIYPQSYRVSLFGELLRAPVLHLGAACSKCIDWCKGVATADAAACRCHEI